VFLKMSFCWDCGTALAVIEEEEEEEEGNKKRTRKGKRCKKCANAAVVKRRHANPCALLQHRLYNTFRKTWPNADPSLWSIETVKEVWERCEQKSVISGETNHKNLCISYKRRPANKEEAPLLEDLVVITTKEAQALAHYSHEKRLEKFEQIKE